VTAEVEPEVLLEPDDLPAAPTDLSQSLDAVSIHEDDTFSPPPSGSLPLFVPEAETPPLPQQDDKLKEIRENLEATGDLPPQPTETFVIPSASLEEAPMAAPQPAPASSDPLGSLSDFDSLDDESLDLGGGDSLDLGASLDDLDDEE
jgi:hypothetical protein